MGHFLFKQVAFNGICKRNLLCMLTGKFFLYFYTEFYGDGLLWIIDDYGKAKRSLFVYHDIENEYSNLIQLFFKRKNNQYKILIKSATLIKKS